MSDFQKLWNEKPWWKEGTTDKEMAEFYYKKGLEGNKEPVAEVPCSDRVSWLRRKIKKAFNLYDIEDLTVSGNCGCCGEKMLGKIMDKRWKWGLCDKCKAN